MPNDDMEKRRQANRDSYQKHKEERKEKNRLWRAANPERMKQLNREWYVKNRDYALKKNRQWREANPEAMKAHMRRWYLENKTQVAEATRLQRTGCTPEQYQELLVKQEGRCAICQRLPGDKSLAADHCHTTNVIRGLLCFHCNTMIGMAGDNAATLRAGAEYLAGPLAAEP